MRNYGWKGTLDSFKGTETNEILESLCMYVYGQTIREAISAPKEESTLPQIRAWEDSIEDLRAQLKEITGHGELIFEYELPRSGGRRPDVLLFMKGQLLVLGFK